MKKLRMVRGKCGEALNKSDTLVLFDTLLIFVNLDVSDFKLKRTLSVF